jgi:ArsR family transcriptional regulator, arsenate/arsenite/antimonite-responsive transcriptional repressor
MVFNLAAHCRMTACAIPTQSAASEAPIVVLDDLDALFKGFADPTRLRVLNALAAGALCVCDLVELLGLAQPAVSRHLAYLRRMGLVEASREWKFVHYRLAEPTNAVHRNLVACVRGCFTGVPALDAERAAAVVRVRERAQVPCAIA